MNTIALVALLSIFGCWGVPTHASVITLRAILDSAHARPPDLVPGQFGQATATIDVTSGAFFISGTSGTVSRVVSAEVRRPNNPPADALGPVIVQLTSSWSFNGGSVDGAFDGSAMLSASQISELLSGNDFVSVDTAPALGVGGALIVVPEPASMAIIGAFATIILPRRRARV